MERNYKYAIRKTTLGVASVAIAAFLAGQGQEVQAAENHAMSHLNENTNSLAEDFVETSGFDVSPSSVDSTTTEVATADNLTNEGSTAETVAAPAAAELAPAEGVANGVNATAEKETLRDGVAKNEDGKVKTDKENSVSADENQVGNYRVSDLANNGISGSFTAETVGTTKEGVTVKVVNPSYSFPEGKRRKFGIQIDIDREKSQRTYNGVYVTDNQRGAPVDGQTNGEIIKPNQDPDFSGVNYPTTLEQESNISADVSKGRQTEINISTGKGFLADLNKVGNNKTNIAWKSQYTEDNPNQKMFTGENFGAGFSVNPYPNENKKLSIIQVVGDTTVDKVPVKGQYVKTGARIGNLDPEDYTRVTSEVYHPDGTVVDPSEARAILVSPANKSALAVAMGVDESTLTEGDIVFKMPKGALEDPESIFNNKRFEGIQSLRAEFFARPRTAEEFTAIVNEVNAIQGYEDKYYVGTDAGTQVIIHNGQEVKIDKQGIARYDHYNSLGEITVHLDDTRFYEQTFNRIQSEDDTAYSNALRPGQSITLKINSPSGKLEGVDPSSKNYEEMEAARVEGLTKGSFIEEFKKEAEAKGWKIETTPGNPSEFTVIAPTTANPGDTMYLPVVYTYTNGSTDNHNFYFVVKDSDNNKPEYHAKAGFQGDKLTLTPEISDNPNKLKPISFELVPNEQGEYIYKDDKGNVWTDVTINSQTGEVTAVVPENTDIIGGEILHVPVKANYIAPITGEKRVETVKAQFIARPKYKATVTHETTKEIPFDSREEYDESLPLGVIKIELPGTPGQSKLTFEQVVINGVKGHYDDQGQFVEGLKKVTETKILDPVDRLVKVGVKPAVNRITIPMTTEYIVDPTLKVGQEIMEKGQNGEVTVKTVRDPKTGEVKITQEVTSPMQPRKIRVAPYQHINDIPYETTVITDNNLPAGEKVVEQEGIVGKTETRVTPAQIADLDELNDYLTNGDVDGGFLKNGEINYDKIAKFMVEKGYWDKTLYNKNAKVFEEIDLGNGEIYREEWEEAQYDGKSIDQLLDIDKKNGPQGKILIPGRVTTKDITKKQDQIIKVGTKTTGTVVDTDEIPFKYKVEFDPDFYKNYPDATKNYKIVTPGQAGSNKKTWTIENSKVVGEPLVETVAPVNAVIKVGQKDYTGSFETVDKDPIPYETEYIVDNTLEPGKEVVENPGELGEKTTTTTHTIQNGQVTASTPGQSIQTKDPVKRVVRIGAKSNGSYQVTEPIPFQVEVKKDPSLKKGEYKLETPGKPGSQTKTLTIENSQVTATSEPIINEQPTNAVVLVGDQDFTGKVSHDVTEKVPFPIKIVEDPTMDKGTYHVDQEGVPGSKTTTYTQAIKNGTADGALTSTVKAESAPQEHIIRVGTKPLTGSTTVMTTNQKPFDVEIEYDNTKPAGSVEVVPNTGVPGEESKTTPVTAQDGTVTPGTTTTTETKAPVNKKIIVGTQGYNGEFSHEYTNVVPFETEVEVDPSLTPNAVVEVQKGQLGETTTKVTQTITNGVPGEKVVSDPVQTKAPVNRKIKVGAKTEGVHTYTEDLPFNYTVEYDPAIQAGKYEIVTPGTVGSRTTEWPITNSVVGQGKVIQETPATNALIKVGNKDFTGQVSHTETVPVPNTVEIRYNPNVKAGETKVLEAGKPGSVDVTYSQVIKNGQAEGDLVKTEANRVEPVNRVIEVGTQPVSGTETPIQQDVPVEVEYVYDNTKDKGFVQAGQVTPGKTQSKVISKVVDGQVVNTVENVVTSAKQQIIVGTKDYTGNFEYKDTDVIPNHTQVTINPNLAPNEIKVVEAGNTGLKERTVRQSFTNGKLGEQVLGDYTTVREPKDRVIEIGAKTTGSFKDTDTIPFEVEVKYDPSLKKGEWKYANVNGVDQRGVSGIKERTITIENSKVSNVSDFTTTKAPQKAVILVGNEDLTGNFTTVDKDSVPFEVEYKVDPNLAPGTEVVDQEGVLGEAETPTTHTIVNGQVTESTPGETKQTKAPVKKIVRIGAKTDGSYTHTEEIPFKVVVEVDPSLNKGEYKVETPGQVGQKTTTVTIENSQVVGSPNAVVTKEAVTEVIKVGDKDFTGQVSHTEHFETAFKVIVRRNEALKPGQVK
ncbi:G5 domain-containing protein, partial [Aerococcus mictus]